MSIEGYINILISPARPIVDPAPAECRRCGWTPRRCFGISPRDDRLQTKALIMIIFVNVLLDKGLISGETFTALLLMAVVSTLLKVPMVAGRLRRARELIYRAA
jgi:hypothetical protein